MGSGHLPQNFEKVHTINTPPHRKREPQNSKMTVSSRAGALSLVVSLSFHLTCAQIGVDSSGRLQYAGLSPEELAGFGVLDEGVMEEAKRLSEVGRTAAVQAILDGTGALTMEDMPTNLQDYVIAFNADMRGEAFLGVADIPENGRIRKALFIAACRTLARDSRSQYEGTHHGTIDEYDV